MVKRTDGKLTPVSMFLLVIVLVMNLLSVVACFNGSTTQNTTTPLPPNPNHLQNSYPAPNWWKPCIPSQVITVSIIGINRQVCTAWDQSQPAAQCDSINYQKFTGTATIPLTSWRGIDVCSPRPNDTSNSDHYTEFSSSGSVEQEFECTELVKRYLYLAYGLPSLGGTDGAQVVDNYTAAYSSLHKVANDGTMQMFPTEGDVLSFSGLNITHTAIVTGLTDMNTNGIGSATIHIIEQNWADTSGTRPLSMSKWIIGGSVISWMTTRSLQEVLGTSTQAASTPSQAPAPVPTPTQPPTPTPSPTPTDTPTPVPTDTPTPVPTPTDTPPPTTLSSGTWQDPYGGASYVGDSVTLQLVVQGSTVTGTMTGDTTGDSTAVQGQDGPLSSFNSTDQQYLNYIIQHYGSGTGIFLVYTNSSDFEGAAAGSRYYAVLQQDGSMQGFWYFPSASNPSEDEGGLTFNIKS